jgi:hypothetical protein
MNYLQIVPSSGRSEIDAFDLNSASPNEILTRVGQESQAVLSEIFDNTEAMTAINSQRDARGKFAELWAILTLKRSRENSTINQFLAKNQELSNRNTVLNTFSVIALQKVILGQDEVLTEMQSNTAKVCATVAGIEARFRDFGRAELNFSVDELRSAVNRISDLTTSLSHSDRRTASSLEALVKADVSLHTEINAVETGAREREDSIRQEVIQTSLALESVAEHMDMRISWKEKSVFGRVWSRVRRRKPTPTRVLSVPNFPEQLTAEVRSKMHHDANVVDSIRRMFR